MPGLRLTVGARRSPVQQALDLTVFAPLGIALAAREALPAWTEKARERFGQQVMVARMVGEHAARHGHKVAARAIRQSTDTLVGLGIIPGPAPRTAPAPGATAGPPGGTGGGPSTNGGRAAGSAEPGPPGAPAEHRAEASAELAIPGYDSLSASQVVQRLAGLAPPELAAVEAYEGAGRGRRTILNRISQLQSGGS